MSCAEILMLLLLLCPCSSLLAEAQSASSQSTSPDGIVPKGAVPEYAAVSKGPSGVILVPGAVPSASDSWTPTPESGVVADGVYANRYFGVSYPIPSGFAEKYKGPPPSDGGHYVLAFIRPSD